MIARTWRGWASVDSMDDVRAFAGEDPEQAVVEQAARRALNRWDSRVTHDEVVAKLS